MFGYLKICTKIETFGKKHKKIVWLLSSPCLSPPVPCPTKSNKVPKKEKKEDLDLGLILYQMSQHHQKGQKQVPLSHREESQVLYLNGIIMVSWAHNMCGLGLEPIDSKSNIFLVT